MGIYLGAQGGTRTRTLANYPLKVACLPISPPGLNQIFAETLCRFNGAHYKVFYCDVKHFLKNF